MLYWFTNFQEPETTTVKKTGLIKYDKQGLINRISLLWNIKVNVKVN